MLRYAAPLDQGVICLLDPKLYPGTGAIVQDVIAGANWDLENAPSYTAAADPYFDLDGVDQAISMAHGAVAGMDLSSGTTRSFLIWGYVASGVGNGDPIAAKKADVSNTGLAGYGLRHIPGTVMRGLVADTSVVRQSQTSYTLDAVDIFGVVATNDASDSVADVADGVLNTSPDTGALATTTNNTEDLTVGSDGNRVNFSPVRVQGIVLLDFAPTQTQIDNIPAALSQGPLYNGRAVLRGVARGVLRGVA